MKIAYQDKDCFKVQAGYWSDCIGCIFHIGTYGVWPCDLIPGVKCSGLDIYKQTDELEEVFRI